MNYSVSWLAGCIYTSTSVEIGVGVSSTQQPLRRFPDGSCRAIFLVRAMPFYNAAIIQRWGFEDGSRPNDDESDDGADAAQLDASSLR